MQNVPSDKAQETALHSRLLELHRMLLDLVRKEYEVDNAPVATVPEVARAHAESMLLLQALR